MGALDHLRAVGAGRPLERMEVAEFGHTVYWKPITLAERAKFFGDGNLTLDKFAEIVMRKALNEKGDRLYDYDDKQTMLNTPGIDSAVQKLALAMLKTPAYEDIEKN